MWAPASAYLELDVPRKPGLFALVCLTAASLVVTTVWLSHFQANDPNVQHERHRIRVLCIALPSRVAHISGQFAALERLAPGEFDMTVMEAVASVDDPRVAGWSSRAVFEDKEAAIEGSGGKPYLCYLSHVLAAGIIAAEKAALPSIVIEDDVLLHSDFYRVVPAILRRPARFPEDGLLQLGYSPQFDPKPDASREVIQWDATAFCIFVARESVRVHSVPAPHACSAAAAGDRAFSVGRALEEWSWGTQGYAQTASRALNLWKSRFDGVNVKLTVENQVYLATHPYRVSPPLLVPDFSFESTLGHDTGLADVYASFTGFVDWSDYTRSPLVCPAPSVGSAALTSSCLSATNNHWTLRAVEDSQGKSFQFSLSRRSNLCLAVSDRADVAASGDAGADVAATAGKATLQRCSGPGYNRADVFDLALPEERATGRIVLGAIRHPASGGMCLEVVGQSETSRAELPILGASLTLASCSGGPNQAFTILVDEGGVQADRQGRLATMYERACVAAC